MEALTTDRHEVIRGFSGNVCHESAGGNKKFGVDKCYLLKIDRILGNLELKTTFHFQISLQHGSLISHNCSL